MPTKSLRSHANLCGKPFGLATSLLSAGLVDTEDESILLRRLMLSPASGVIAPDQWGVILEVIADQYSPDQILDACRKLSQQQRWFVGQLTYLVVAQGTLSERLYWPGIYDSLQIPSAMTDARNTSAERSDATRKVTLTRLRASLEKRGLLVCERTEPSRPRDVTLISLSAMGWTVVFDQNTHPPNL